MQPQARRAEDSGVLEANPTERGTSGRPPFLLWILLPAMLGFGAGFFGPLALNPDANQGPLLGIFITGPGGAALGLLLGAVARLLRLSGVRQWQLLTVACVALAGWTLYASLPEPRLIGYLVDAELRGCSPPSQSLDRAVSHWESRLAGTDVRPGWMLDARMSAAIDPGVVLELNVARRFGIYQHRKPWNHGRLMARSRRSPDAPRRYEWPPTSNVPAFLGLSVVVPATDEHRRMVRGRTGP